MVDTPWGGLKMQDRKRKDQKRTIVGKCRTGKCRTKYLHAENAGIMLVNK